MESETNGEADFAAKVNVFRPIILKCVNGAELVPHLVDILSEADRSKVRNIARNESSQKSTEYVLDVIDKIKDGEGKWRAFINALQRADYPHVCEILEGDAAYLYKNENQEKIIKVLAPEIGKLIFPRQIVPLLHSKEIINQRDVEEITAAEDRMGPSEAASLLFDKIPRRIENWYELFLQVLIESEDGRYKHIADIIDEDFVAKKENQLAAKVKDEELKQGEAVFEETEEPHDDKDKEEDNTSENWLHDSGLAAKRGNDLNAESEINNVNGAAYEDAADVLKKLQTSPDFSLQEENAESLKSDSEETEVKCIAVDKTIVLYERHKNSDVSESEPMSLSRNLNKEGPSKETIKDLLPHTEDDIKVIMSERETANEWVENMKKGFNCLFNGDKLDLNLTEEEDMVHAKTQLLGAETMINETHNEDNIQHLLKKDRNKDDRRKDNKLTECWKSGRQFPDMANYHRELTSFEDKISSENNLDLDPKSVNSQQRCMIPLEGDCYVVGNIFKGEIQLHIRQYKRNADGLYPTKKGVTLNLSKWLSLEFYCEQISSLRRKSEAGLLTHDVVLHLGGAVHATISTRYPTVDIRHFWKPKNSADICPTRKGISLTDDKWEKLKESMKIIRDFVPELKDAIK